MTATIDRLDSKLAGDVGGGDVEIGRRVDGVIDAHRGAVASAGGALRAHRGLVRALARLIVGERLR